MSFILSVTPFLISFLFSLKIIRYEAVELQCHVAKCCEKNQRFNNRNLFADSAYVYFSPVFVQIFWLHLLLLLSSMAFKLMMITDLQR